jgi:hypothetical protein
LTHQNFPSGKPQVWYFDFDSHTARSNRKKFISLVTRLVNSIQVVFSLYVGGFGVMATWVDVAEYENARPDVLAQVWLIPFFLG